MNTPRPTLTVRRAITGGAVALALLATTAIITMSPSSPATAQLKSSGQLGPSFADLVEKVKPSVVSISVTNGERAKVAAGPGGPGSRGGRGGGGGGGGIPGLPDLPEDHPLNEFFKNLPRGPAEQGERPSLAQGSGFVISADGFVVTNNHVVENASKIHVSFDGKQKFEADLIGTDPRTDIALLKIKGDKTFPAVKFSTAPGRVGDWVFAVGNPFGLGGTVTAGIISAFNRDIGSGPYDFMQIDAAVNRGNSGGPTFNLDGEVVGVNTAIFSPSGGNVGIAFAIPAKTVTEVVSQLKDKGKVSRGWLGVKIQNIDEDTAASLGLAEARGALVSEITPNGPAATSDLKAQDAILMVNKDKIADSRDLARKIAELAPDVTVDVTVWRNNAEKVVKVKLGMFPGGKDDPTKPDAPKSSSSLELSQLGITLKAATGAPAKDSEGGVVIAEVAAGSDAATKGLKAGDVILQVSGETVTTPDDVIAGVKKAENLKRKAVLLHVKSADSKRYVPVQLKGQG